MRRQTLIRAAGLALLHPLRGFGQAPLHSLVVLPPDFLDDQHNPATVEAQNRRLERAHAQFEEELASHGLYRVVDFAPALALYERLRAQQLYLHRCADCAVQIGRERGGELSMATWVQKVSELILNVNCEIYDVASGRSVLSKSVDMRGNDDVSWQRAVRFLVRDMADKRARDPRYGLPR